LKKRDRILALYDDDEVAKVFDAHKDAEAGTLKPEHLPAALKELQVTCQDLKEPLTLDDFKRIARQPNEAEQWFQMIPFSGLLSRSVGKTTLDQIEKLETHEMDRGLQAFFERLQAIVKQRMVKLKSHREKLDKVPDGESKFGGLLEGGDVDDFHRGLADRLGKNIELCCMVYEC